MFGLLSRNPILKSHPGQKDVARLVASQKGIFELRIKRMKMWLIKQDKKLVLEDDLPKVLIRLKSLKVNEAFLEQNIKESAESTPEAPIYLINLPDNGNFINLFNKLIHYKTI